ncbi:hypothetical protein FHX42_005293 [Saccharopolyspora lacisalsi]|uniref:Uncharacterized protein n=1 Tax=Halosaccharopolyspora lacisalsi TaxID=1000566 RepID=A0A839E5H8_9PSEU|nr:hypothetical protein [Halosaccharopolyspora lacisalsi]MBA8827886.1 hypothetical protein [Halosaccharopolyspora lacisalsi]
MTSSNGNPEIGVNPAPATGERVATSDGMFGRIATSSTPRRHLINRDDGTGRVYHVDNIQPVAVVTVTVSDSTHGTGGANDIVKTVRDFLHDTYGGSNIVNVDVSSPGSATITVEVPTREGFAS